MDHQLKSNSLRALVRPSRHIGAPNGPLADWTVALKDNIDVAGDVVERGSRLFAGRIAETTATAAQRLLDAGATLNGRTSLVELCFGSYGLNDITGTPINPWDPQVERAPGGSSSGSAVAVAARLVRAALGSDTAGSIRMPAALCGVTGFKPTHGRVPLDGVFPLAHGYDSVGPIALDAADCATLTAVLADLPALLDLEPAKHGRVAVLPERFWPVPGAPAVRTALLAASDVLLDQGLRVHEATEAPDLAKLTQQAGVLIAAGAWQVLHTHFEQRPQDFGAALSARLRAASEVPQSQVDAAAAERGLAALAFDRWAQDFDVLLLPTVGETAPALACINESGTTLGHFTRWVNHVGGCAISLPAGFDASGLPVAVQLVSRGGNDALLLTIAMAFQQATQWHCHSPDLSRWER